MKHDADVRGAMRRQRAAGSTAPQLYSAKHMRLLTARQGAPATSLPGGAHWSNQAHRQR